MRRDLFGAARLFILPTIALAGVAVFAPGHLALGGRIYALLVGAAVITVLILAVRRAYPPETELDASDRRPTSSARPASLTRIEHEVALGAVGAFDLHYRLVPRMRSIAAGLLVARRQVSVASSPETARAILGEDAWALVRPERPAPEDRLGGGIAASELRHVVDALEAV